MATYPKLFSDLALGILKSSLGFFGAPVDPDVEAHLCNCLTVAHRELEEECDILLTIGDIYDDNLQATYALWVYSKRRTGEGKPDMLRRAIRNRQVCRALTAAQDGECVG